MTTRITTAQLARHVVALETKITALEAQLSAQRLLYKELRDSRPVERRKENTPQVSYWTDARGQVWEKTRVGNRASSRPVQVAAH